MTTPSPSAPAPDLRSEVELPQPTRRPEHWENAYPPDDVRAIVRAALAASPAAQPIDMVLHCPKCHTQHIDAPEPNARIDDTYWDNPPHKSHLCHACNNVWRPADVPTNGVASVKTTGKADSPIAARGAVQPEHEDPFFAVPSEVLTLEGEAARNAPPAPLQVVRCARCGRYEDGSRGCPQGDPKCPIALQVGQSRR